MSAKLCNDCRQLELVGVLTMEAGRCRNCGRKMCHIDGYDGVRCTADTHCKDDCLLNTDEELQVQEP